MKRRKNQRRNPWIAVLLQIIIAGLGHLYLRRFTRGAIFIVFDIVTSVIYLNQNSIEMAIPNLIVTIVAMYDAYEIANEINRNIKEDSGEPKNDMPEVYIR